MGKLLNEKLSLHMHKIVQMMPWVKEKKEGFFWGFYHLYYLHLLESWFESLFPALPPQNGQLFCFLFITCVFQIIDE